MTDLTALLSRVEAATGPDRELDRDILLAVGGAIDGQYWRWPGEERSSSFGALPPFTSSLDATVALVEKLRPDWFFTISNFCPSLEKRAWADIASLGYINEEDGCGDQRSEGHGYAPTCALLAALLRSMIEEEGR